MILHLITNADFTNYQYHEVYIPGGETVTLNGESITTVSDITLPVGVNSTTHAVSGSTSGTIYLIGKRKPEYYQSADGTYPIR
jgi:hypothetical protein